MTWTTFAHLLGGLGFFLLGMKMMTEGLQTAAGPSLQSLLARWTQTRWRGLASGIAITAIVQASGAVTVATIGFVNAGMISLGQAVAVVYGTNVGTTVTGWLVTLVGFSFDLKLFALPMVGVGVALDLASASLRRRAWGQALIGFGLFFVGLDLLKATFGGLATSVPLQSFASLGLLASFLFVLLGMLLTFLMQSSSATMALALTAVGQGLLTPLLGAALIIGANVGTTSTAILVAWRASPAAKRVAAAHVIFNLLTGAVAFLLLHPLLAFLGFLRGTFGFSNDGVGQLATFHTAFNLLGVALLWPWTDRLLRWLETHFDDPKAHPLRPRFLDPTLLSSPRIALYAASQELEILHHQARQIAKIALNAESPQEEELAPPIDGLHQRMDAISEYLHLLNQQSLPSDIVPLLPKALRISGYCGEIAEIAKESIGLLKRDLFPHHNPDLMDEINRYRAGIVAFLDLSWREPSSPSAPAPDRTALHDATLALQTQHEAIKQRLLREGIEGRIPVRKLVHLLEILSIEQRIAEQMKKAALFLLEIQAEYAKVRVDGSAL